MSASSLVAPRRDPGQAQGEGPAPGTAGGANYAVEDLYPPGASYAMTFAAASAVHEQQQQQQQQYQQHQQHHHHVHQQPRARRFRAVPRDEGCAARMFDRMVRALGPMLVLLCWSLVGGVTWVYFNDIVPARGWDASSEPVPALVTGLGLWLLFNIVFNHVHAVMVPPGRVPAGGPPPADIDELIIREQETIRRVGRAAYGFSRYCVACRVPKPPRAHHCSVCGVCVLKQDHHCPWIGGCVGHRNQRYFLLFLVYLLAGSLFVCAVGTPALLWPPARDVWRAHALNVSMAVLLCASAVLAVGFMAGMHLYLAATNQTTIEMYHNRDARRANPAGARNVYDLGSARANIGQVLGPNRPLWRWFLPHTEEFGDGLSYPEADGDAAAAASDMSMTKALEHVA